MTRFTSPKKTHPRKARPRGRPDTIPHITKLQRIEQLKSNASPKPVPDGPQDVMGQRQLKAWQADLDKKIEEVEETELNPEEIPGLKVHLCSLVAPDSPAGQPWTPVYIHSKLMIIDDVFTTHGSANINTRSMQVDSELNIAHDWSSETRALRRRLWGLHTDGKGAQDNPRIAFELWREIMENNKMCLAMNITPENSLVEFYCDGISLRNLD